MSKFIYAPPYTISGQTGKGLNATRLPLEALGVSSLQPTFASMDADSIEWLQRGGTAPDYLQEVSLWDANGRRVFTGNVTAVDPKWDGTDEVTYSVQASGPWWWLEQAELTALVSDSFGNEAERMNFVLPQQDLAISIRSLIDKMQSLGVPLRCGEIAGTFIVPQMTMQGQTAADALRDILGWIPDAMTSIRYDTDGLPFLDISRRISTPVTFIEASNGAIAEPPSISAERQLRPTSVSVQSVRVTNAGERVYNMQTAGDVVGESGVLGRQLLAVSGPGRPDYREAPIDKVTLRTTTSITSLFYAVHPALSKFAPNFGYGKWNFVTGSVQIRESGFTLTINATTKWTVNNVSGSAGVFANYIIGPKLPQWWIEHGVIPQEVTLSATFKGEKAYMTQEELAIATGWGSGDSSANVFTELQISFQAIPLSYPTLTTIIRPRDKSLVQPHEKLAENLYAAQDWTPYTGSIPLSPGYPMPLPGSLVSIRGAVPEWATMGALVTSAQIDLETGASEIELGVPPRIRASSLIDQFQRATSGRMIDL